MRCRRMRATRPQCAAQHDPGASARSAAAIGASPARTSPPPDAHESLDRAADCDCERVSTAIDRRDARGVERERSRLASTSTFGADEKRAITGHPRSSSAATMNFPSHPARPITTIGRGAVESGATARACCLPAQRVERARRSPASETLRAEVATLSAVDQRSRRRRASRARSRARRRRCERRRADRLARRDLIASGGRRVAAPRHRMPAVRRARAASRRSRAAGVASKVAVQRDGRRARVHAARRASTCAASRALEHRRPSRGDGSSPSSQPSSANAPTRHAELEAATR